MAFLSKQQFHIHACADSLNPLNRVNGILIENMKAILSITNVKVSIPSIGSMAFLWYRAYVLHHPHAQVSIPSIGSMAFLFHAMYKLSEVLTGQSQSPQSGQWHSYPTRSSLTSYLSQKKSQSPQSGQWHSYGTMKRVNLTPHAIKSQSPQSGQWHSYCQSRRRSLSKKLSQSPQSGQWHSYRHLPQRLCKH